MNSPDQPRASHIDRKAGTVPGTQEVPTRGRMRATLRRETLFTDSVPYLVCLDVLDLDDLRRALAVLMDRAAHAVQVAGYEQDDAVIERRLTCRDGRGREHRVPADGLDDRRRLIDGVRRAVGADENESVMVRGLSVEAILERWA